jgi:DNA polymerase
MNRTTSFELDERQRAMLAEMGVRVWQPAVPVEAEEGPGAVLPPAQAVAPAPPVPTPGSDLVQGRAPGSAMPSAQVPAPAVPQARLATPAVSLERQPRPTGIDAMDWTTLAAAVAGCEACALCHSRRNTVFGTGDTSAQWMVVGEAPGEQEDRQGEPFVGPAGQLLDNMLKAVGLARSAEGAQGVYIANVLKCRPPANRNPEPAEVAQCEPYLRRQVALVQPRIILAMGRFAVQSLLQTSEPIGKLRGRVHSYQGVPVIVTYHPAYLLRNLPDKAKAWADLCLALSVMQSPA